MNERTKQADSERQTAQEIKEFSAFVADAVREVLNTPAASRGPYVISDDDLNNELLLNSQLLLK